MKFGAALKRSRDVFLNRESLRDHPLRDTHKNDVPVIAAELMVEAYAEGRREALGEAMQAVVQLDGWENSSLDASRVIRSLMEQRSETPQTTNNRRTR